MVVCGNIHFTLPKVQKRATKFILNDFVMDHKTWLSTLNLLLLSMTLELNDMKSVRCPSSLFNILDYVHFCDSSGNRSSKANKLQHPATSSTSSSNFYFNRLPRLWNCLPIIDGNVSTSAAISCLKAYFWYHFLTKFNLDDLCVPSTISVHVHAFCFHLSPNFTRLLFSITVGFHIYCGCPSVAIASLYFTSVISNNNNNIIIIIIIIIIKFV